MDFIDTSYCFYSDPDYVSDADRDSRLLQRWHAVLWSKELPDGSSLEWETTEFPCVVHTSDRGDFRLSSDTIATTHGRYRAVSHLYAALGAAAQDAYECAFYTIGGFLVFPRHPYSLNQVRGQRGQIADRFDLTLECIRRHYVQGDSPLADVLRVDADFFALFGIGPAGFAAYVDFFHLGALVEGGTVRDLLGTGEVKGFDEPALPQSQDAYARYLDQIAQFVEARNARIAAWCRERGMLATPGA